ncbi:MAG: hypothetical protein WC205_01800, partial [Opitutaceae bacterium]
NATGTQTITAGTDVTVGATTGSTVTVQADNGAQTITATNLIDLSADASMITVNSETDAQAITAATGSITFDADAVSTINVTASTTQDITATANEIVVDALNSTINVLADTGAQTITANTNVDVNANNSTVTIDATGSTQSITAETGAITIDATVGSTVLVTAADQQDIDATLGLISLTANASGITVQNATGDQTITAATNITGTANAGSTVLAQADNGVQTVMAGGLIDLSADASTITVNSDTDAQVLTSTGVTNLTGINGGSTLVTAVDSTLTNTGGILTGDAVIGTDGSTTAVTINNSGDLTVVGVDAAHIHVNGATVTFMGSGSVGATDAGARLVTNADTLVFDTPNVDEVLALDERVGDVSIQGTVYDLNLILSDTGSVSDSDVFTATSATIQTTAGDIDLSNNGNQVDAFNGLIANGGSISYTGTGDTTFGNLDMMTAAIAGTSGVYATNDITIATDGKSVFTADVVESAGVGNIDLTASEIVLAAANATVGGNTGPIDPALVGLIKTADGTQSYNSPVVLLKNTHISASAPTTFDDSVIFNDTINADPLATVVDGVVADRAGLEIGSSPTFNAYIGDVTPLAYLILNSTTGGSTFTATSGSPADGPATVTLTGSFINNGFITLDGFADNFTFIVDALTADVGASVFQGGMIFGHISQDPDFGNTITVFGAKAGSVTFDNITIPTSLYQSYTFDDFGVFSYTGSNVFTPGGAFFKGPSPFGFENLSERLEREAIEKEATLAYDGSVIPAGIEELAGSVPETPGEAGGVATSTYDLFTDGQIEVVTQTVFGNVIVLP